MESQNLGQTQQFEMLVKEIKQLCEKLESVQTTMRHKQEQQRHEIQKHEEMMDEFHQQFMNLNYTFLNGIETFNLSLKQRLNEILGKELETEIIETKINSSPSGTRSNVTEHFVQQELSRSKNDIDYAELQDYSIQREMEEPATEESQINTAEDHCGAKEEWIFVDKRRKRNKEYKKYINTEEKVPAHLEETCTVATGLYAEAISYMKSQENNIQGQPHSRHSFKIALSSHCERNERGGF